MAPPQAGSRSDQQPGVYAAVDRTSSTPGRRREFHPPPPTDPRMKVSLHGARAVQVPGRVAQLPVREQAGCPLADPAEPCPRPAFAVLQPLVLPPCPAHQMAVDALA